MTAQPQKPKSNLTEQRCPVCGKVLFEVFRGTVGVVKIRCRRCERLRDVKIDLQVIEK